MDAKLKHLENFALLPPMQNMIPPQALPPKGYHFRDVQLEMSLKPFWDGSSDMQEMVCREAFMQWLPLCRYAESVSIMLWIGDGSEILEYTGDSNLSFEWARYHGAANHIAWQSAPGAKDSGDPDHNAIGMDALVRDPERRGVHSRSYLYRPESAVFTYKWLAALTDTLRRVGTEVTGKKILVGTTFDIGPEFAVSRFKYEWHPEICGGGSLFGGKFIRCDARLMADERRYAAFEHGIPQDTSFGTFLGAQSRSFIADVGLDFIWFSNGFGFGLEPWALTGAIFDGLQFHQETSRDVAERIIGFWRDFRKELPNIPVRTRGTNLGTGIDLGSDASPLNEIYDTVPQVEPPVNSPWAALDGDIGLELVGWMSHIARTPGRGYRYRYYIHDPWWMNSPWLDRYQRQPYDIYLPLAVSRLQADGRVEPPSDIALLSIDDSHGTLPPVVPVEVISHILHAREFLPDGPGPIVWIYPSAENDRALFGSSPTPDRPFFGDWFVREMIADGVPVNTVACAEELATTLENDGLKDSILLAPVSGGEADARLLDFASRGGRVLFYGPLDRSERLLFILGASLAAPVEGDFELEWVEAAGRRLRHVNFLSAGGCREIDRGEGNVWRVTARVEHARRLAAAHVVLPSGGQIGWVRGSLATAEYDPAQPRPIKGPRLKRMDPAKFLAPGALVRRVLSRLGISIAFEQTAPESASPMLTIHRHRNAYVFSGYQPDTLGSVRLATPAGAPLFPGLTNRLEEGVTVYHGPPAWHHVCRAFVEQSGCANISCRILPPIQHGYRGRLLISGLQESTLRFFPETGTEAKLEVLAQPLFPYFKGDFLTPLWRAEGGLHAELRGVSGEILFSW